MKVVCIDNCFMLLKIRQHKDVSQKKYVFSNMINIIFQDIVLQNKKNLYNKNGMEALCRPISLSIFTI